MKEKKIASLKCSICKKWIPIFTIDPIPDKCPICLKGSGAYWYELYESTYDLGNIKLSYTLGNITK